MAFVRSYLTALFLPVFHSFLWLLNSMAFVRSYLTALFLPVFLSFLWLLFILPLGMDTNLLSNCCWNTERTSTLKTGLVINGGAREVLVYYYYYHYYSHVNLSKMTNWIDLAILTGYILGAARNGTLNLYSAVLSYLRGGHDTLRSFCLNSRVLHLSVIIWPAFRSRKLLSPHLPTLVPVDGATFVACCLSCFHSCRVLLP